MKTIAFYTSKDSFGYRENSFDWKVGERILSKDGMSTQKIVRVVPATALNLQLAHRIMEKVNRYSGNGRTVTKLILVDGGLRVSSKTTTWKDGTGLTYFLEAIKSLEAAN